MCVRVCMLNICITYIYTRAIYTHVYTHAHSNQKKHGRFYSFQQTQFFSPFSVPLTSRCAEKAGQGSRTGWRCSKHHPDPVGPRPVRLGDGSKCVSVQVFGAHSLRSDLSLGSILEALHRQRSSLRQPNAQPAQEHSCMSTLLYPLSSLQAWIVY